MEFEPHPLYFSRKFQNPPLYTSSSLHGMFLILSYLATSLADQGRSDVCVVFTMSLCTLELKQTVISLLCHTALKLGEQAPKSYLKISCEFQLHILSNKKVSAAKDYG